MRTYVTPMLGLSLAALFGCQDKIDQARDEQRKATAQTAQAEQLVREGKFEKADETLKKADDDRIKAAEDRALATHERVPVAGHDWTPMERSLKSELGDDWTIDAVKTGIDLFRLQLKVPDVKMTSKVDETIRSLKDDYPLAKGSFSGDEVWLRGAVETCADAAKSVSRFAKIDGVNKIHVGMSCTVK